MALHVPFWIAGRWSGSVLGGFGLFDGDEPFGGIIFQ